MGDVFDKEKARQEVAALVVKYHRLVESGKLKSYTEEMTKKDFILPLFRALGWNVEDGDEVTAEEKISNKRVDYGFRIDDIPKLFVEAKALRVDLDKVEFAEQAINYAWHKGATWAVLTDFEGVKVFNAEWKSINPLQNMLFGINCNQFLDNFDQLLLLSRESLEQGLLDKEAEKWGKKAKKIPVDKQLLSDLTSFRELLTKNILKNNSSKNLSEDDLDETVQRILDRLIFIRTLEDKQMEAPVLQALIREDTHKKVYNKLNLLFRNIDETYNSKLFRKHLCEELIIDDDILEKIIRGLFKTSDNTVHYDFAAIDADVLGNMYEQYLGSILKKTAKRAKLTNGKIHRKEQGIYYTPTYVVDYIVKNTIGELAKNKKFDLNKIKVLDPACGSGSFLMKAFDYLVKLNNDGAEQTKLDLTGASATYGKKIEILKNNIFGVDLDKKAVEIAQLNLLLKAAEKKHRLPTLQENIKVGNSLIDDSEVAGNKAFKWNEEFEEIIENGGFDVVIGNPPYVRQEQLSQYKRGFEKYTIYNSSNDLYAYFFEKGISLLKEGGYFAIIVSSKFTKTKYGKILRDYILDNTKIVQFIDFGELPVFEDATTYPCIIILQKTSQDKKRKINKLLVSKISSLSFKNLSDEVNTHAFIMQQDTLTNQTWTFERGEKKKLKEKIEKNCILLKDFIGNRLYRGITTGCNEAFVIDKTTKNELINEDKKSEEIIRKFLSGKNIKKYALHFNNLYLLFTYTGVKIDSYPAVKKYLSNFKNKLDKVWEVKHKKHPWYELRGCKYYSEFQEKKIIFPDIASESRFAYDEEGHFCGNTAYIIPFNEEYLLGILNSKVIEYYFKQISTRIRGGFYRYIASYVEKIPIKNNLSDKVKTILTRLVKERLALSKKIKLLMDKSTDEKARLEKEIEKIDTQIDQEVYRIYGLSEEEIKVIEESLRLKSNLKE